MTSEMLQSLGADLKFVFITSSAELEKVSASGITAAVTSSDAKSNVTAAGTTEPM